MNDKIASHTQRRIRRLELLVYSLGFVVFLLLVWILSASFQSRSIIKAPGFQLVSDSDIVMGEFGFNGTSPILYLADEAGRKRLIATHDIEGTRVFLNDAESTTRVGIAQFSHGGGGIALTVRRVRARQYCIISNKVACVSLTKRVISLGK